jgi:hypothetical protein
MSCPDFGNQSCYTLNMAKATINFLGGQLNQLDRVDIDVDQTELATGSKVHLAEVNVRKDGKTARFWLSVRELNGRPVLTLTANGKTKETIKTVNGTYLDLAARRAEKGLPAQPAQPPVEM